MCNIYYEDKKAPAWTLSDLAPAAASPSEQIIYSCNYRGSSEDSSDPVAELYVSATTVTPASAQAKCGYEY